MLARISTALLAFILASMVPLHGQDQSASVGSAEPIATDRPAITDSSVVVPAGSLQVENGFLETSSRGRSDCFTVHGFENMVRQLSKQESQAICHQSFSLSIRIF